MSVHPTTTNAEIEFVCTSIKALAENHKTWLWIIPIGTNEFIHKGQPLEDELVKVGFHFINKVSI
jgi:hypothetical protein